MILGGRREGALCPAPNGTNKSFVACELITFKVLRVQAGGDLTRKWHQESGLNSLECSCSFKLSCNGRKFSTLAWDLHKYCSSSFYPSKKPNGLKANNCHLNWNIVCSFNILDIPRNNETQCHLIEYSLITQKLPLICSPIWNRFSRKEQISFINFEKRTVPIFVI